MDPFLIDVVCSQPVSRQFDLGMSDFIGSSNFVKDTLALSDGPAAKESQSRSKNKGKEKALPLSLKRLRPSTENEPLTKRPKGEGKENTVVVSKDDVIITYD